MLPGAVAGPGGAMEKGLIGAENKTEDEDFGLKYINNTVFEDQ